MQRKVAHFTIHSQKKYGDVNMINTSLLFVMSVGLLATFLALFQPNVSSFLKPDKCFSFLSNILAPIFLPHQKSQCAETIFFPTPQSMLRFATQI